MEIFLLNLKSLEKTCIQIVKPCPDNTSERSSSQHPIVGIMEILWRALSPPSFYARYVVDIFPHCLWRVRYDESLVCLFLEKKIPVDDDFLSKDFHPNPPHNWLMHSCCQSQK